MKNLPLTLLLFSLFSFSQSKTFIILDSISKKPVDLVHITYSNSFIGSISNRDGKVKINLIKDSIYISHINYKNSVYSSKVLLNKDTIFIQPKLNTLREIVLYNYDIKRKLKEVLDNYKEYYYTGQVTNTTTYKENFEVNDTLVRLFQAQYKWWTKYNYLNLEKAIKKQNKISLERVDFSKIVSLEESEKNGGFLKNVSLIKFSNLNFNLLLLTNTTKNIYISSISKNNQTTDITFDADYFEDNKNLFNYKNSIISIDNKTKSIKYVLLNMVYNANEKIGLSRKSKTRYIAETTNHKVELSFKKYRKKYSLSYFTSTLNGFFTMNDIKAKLSVSQKFLITNTEKGRKNKKTEGIDLDAALYDYIPLNKRNEKEIEILLTEKEKQFLNAVN